MDYSSSPLDAGVSSAGLTLTSVDADYLRSAGKWGRFIAIVGFVFMAFGVLSILITGGAMLGGGLSDLDGGGAGMAGMGALIFIFYGIFFAFAIYVLFQLYRFSSNAIQAADRMDQTAMTASLQSLSRLFMIYGILMIIYLAIIGFTILIGLIGGAAAFI